MTDPIKIIITDDQKLFRQGLKNLLEMENITTIAEADNGKELLDLLEDGWLRPDLILLDLEMPVMDGNKTMAQLSKKFPKIKIIILSTFAEGALHNDYLAKGASSYLSKTTDGKLVAETIRKVICNDHSEALDKQQSLFTAKEIEIIPLLLRGKTSKEIALHFGVTEKAIEASRNRLYQKTECSNGIEFSSYCTRFGLAYLGTTETGSGTSPFKK